MLTTKPDPPAGGPPSTTAEGLTVRVRGRDYPLPDDRQPQAVSEPSERRRNADLVDRLWTDLPFAALPPGCAEPTQIVTAYTSSLARLIECQRDVERLFTTMCRVNLQYRAHGVLHDDIRDSAVPAKWQEMLQRGGFRPVLDDGTLTAELAAQPPELIRLHLSESLRSMTERFVREIFAALDRFVGADTVGLIEWFGETNSACKFHFFNETVVQKETGRTTLLGWEQEGRRLGNDHREVLQDVTHEIDGVHVHLHARHEHHLMNATQCAPGAQTHPIPEAAGRLIQAVPAWLLPGIRIVEGVCVRERIIERELRREKWQKKQEETTRRVERVDYEIDPAVTLDCYVLTGWGVRAIEQERERRELHRQDRQRSERDTSRRNVAASAGKQFWLAAASCALLQAVALALVILSVIAPPLVIAGAGLTVAGVLPAGWWTLHLLARSRMRHADWTYLVIGATAVLLASAGVQILVLAALQSDLLLLGTGAVSLAAGCVFGRQTAARFRLLRELAY